MEIAVHRFHTGAKPGHFETSNNSLSHEQTDECSGVCERSEYCGASEWVSSVSERANGRASGPVFTSLFLAALLTVGIDFLNDNPVSVIWHPHGNRQSCDSCINITRHSHAAVIRLPWSQHVIALWYVCLMHLCHKLLSRAFHKMATRPSRDCFFLSCPRGGRKKKKERKKSNVI